MENKFYNNLLEDTEYIKHDLFWYQMHFVLYGIKTAFYIDDAEFWKIYNSLYDYVHSKIANKTNKDILDIFAVMQVGASK